MKRKSIDVKTKIKEYFFANPTAKVQLRELERILNLSFPSIVHYCKELKNEEIITIAKTGNVSFYTSNQSSEKFKLEKKLFNIKQIYECKLIEFLKRELHNPTIILFGSYSRGEDIETSDIDLYIETMSKKEINLEKFESKLNKKIQIFRYKSIEKIENPNLSNNILNGITLNGFVEVFK